MSDDHRTGGRAGFLRGLVVGVVAAPILSDYVFPFIRPRLDERVASDLIACVVGLLIVAWFLPQIFARWFGLDLTASNHIRPSKAHGATDVAPETHEGRGDKDG